MGNSPFASQAAHPRAVACWLRLLSLVYQEQFGFSLTTIPTHINKILPQGAMMSRALLFGFLTTDGIDWNRGEYIVAASRQEQKDCFLLRFVHTLIFLSYKYRVFTYTCLCGRCSFSSGFAFLASLFICAIHNILSFY
ncbi:hypothetical protein F4818DRAFT_318713 [Hypoxylon cercidicola]|nr:hypothetical protein F4818DRAFT_318713 [Hypoxylon cercidicola]